MKKNNKYVVAIFFIASAIYAVAGGDYYDTIQVRGEIRVQEDVILTGKGLTSELAGKIVDFKSFGVSAKSSLIDNSTV